ncbi:MAG: PAS domain S-box protein [Pseudomonadota bacterium]
MNAPAHVMRDVGTDGHQLDLMYRRFPHAIMSAMVLSAIMVAAMWWSVPHRALLGWLGLIWGVALLNGVHTWRYLTLGALQPEPGRWKKWIALGTVASGFSWGLAVVWLPQSVNDPAMLFVVFCLAGVTAYSTTWLAAFPYVLFAYQCAALLPLILRLATSGEPFYAFLSVTVVFYLMTMVGLARHLREAVDEAFRTHAHNRKLQDALAQVAGLERENALLRRMVEETQDPAIFVMRPESNGHFYYINEAVCRHFGASREEVMKWHVSDWDPHFDAQKGKQLWQTLAQQENKSMRFETEHIRASGELVPVEVTLNLAEYAGERFTVGYFRDIAKQKADAAHLRQLELEALRAAGERSFRDVFNQFGEGIFLLDATDDGRFKVAALNPAAERLVGVSDAAARSRFTEALFPEPFASHLSQHDRRCVETGQLVEYEEKFDLPAGKRRYSITLVPLRDASGKVNRLAGVMRDITASKALENALRERAEMERRLNALVSNAPGFFYTLVKDGDGQYSMPFASAGIRDIYGVRPEAVAADIESIHELACPDDQEYLTRLTFESARDLTPFQIEFRVRHPEKGEIWVEARSMPERLPDGGTVWHGFMHEITARKRIEEQLRLKEFVLDTARDAVYIVGEDLRFTYVNREACRALDYSREELLQMTPFDIDPDCTDEAVAAIEEGSVTAVSPGTYVIERRHRRRDGSTFPVEITAFTEIFEGRALGITVVRDLTERKRAEETLQESRERYRQIFDHAEEGLFLFDVLDDGQFRIVEVNPAFERLVGIQREAMIGKCTAEILPEAVAEKVDAKYRRCLMAGTVYREEIELELPAGKRIYHSTLVPVKDDEGRIFRIVGITEDVTEQRQLEAAVVAREQEYRTLAANSPDVVVRYDRDCRRLYVNPNWELVNGLSAQAVIGKRPTEIAGPVAPMARELERKLREVAETRQEGKIELTWRNEAGELVCFDMTATPEFDWHGEVQGVLTVSRDISERKRLEFRVENERARLRGFFAAMPDLAWIKDMEGRYLACNPLFEKLFGASEAEIFGKTDFDFVDAEQAAFFRRKDAEAIAADAPCVNEEWVTFAEDGRRALLETTKMPLRDAQGRILGVLGVGHDITERKQMEHTLVEREREFRSLAENLPDNVVRFDLDGRIKYVNPQFARMLGRAPAELTDKMLGEVVPSRDNACLPALRSVLQTGEPVDVELKMPASDGLVHTHHVRFSAERDSAGKTIGALAVGHDITVRKALEEMLVQREYEFRTLVEHSPDTIARYDGDCRRIYVNPRFAEMAGDEAHLLGKTPSEFPGGEASSAYEEKIRAVFATGNEAEFELVWPGEGGRSICSLIHLTPERDQSGRIASVLAVGRDITELNEYREKIHALAFYDTLTQLPNRVLFNDRMRLMLADAERHAHLAAVMLLDLDRFKEINDTLGHAAGDELLREAGARLMHCVRNYDTVARLGGDEFAILLPQVRAANDLTTIANKMLAAFATPFLLGEKEIFISTSIGIALYPDDSTDGDDLLKFADSAMYHAKRSGRNNFRFYSKELSASANERLALESDLRKALARGELELHYQPKISLEDTALAGSEALLRWRHPVRGMVPPDRFIGIAEDSGLIVEIGEWVLQTACAVARKWNGEGKPLHKVAVNLSARQFVSNDLVGSVRRVLDEAGCRPEWIELEITESLLLEGDGEILETLQALRDMGITIAIDDFGTGYSALSYLTRFPIHTLKIDRSFTRHVDSGGHHAELVKAIISLARCLNLEVVAEGVETGEQEAFLKSCGCQTVQGYWYGKPMPEQEFKNFLATPFCEAG